MTGAAVIVASLMQRRFNAIQLVELVLLIIVVELSSFPSKIDPLSECRSRDTAPIIYSNVRLRFHRWLQSGWTANLTVIIPFPTIFHFLTLLVTAITIDVTIIVMMGNIKRNGSECLHCNKRIVLNIRLI